MTLTATSIHQPLYSEAHLRASRAGNRFLLFLSLVLAGYAIDGKGFAYVGIPPLFIGEITMLVGLFVLARTSGWRRLWDSPPILALSAFMLFGLLRTVPYLDRYGVDALRDACLYYYGAFAIIVAALLITEPTRLATLLIYFRRFAKSYLGIILGIFVIYHFAAGALPHWPWGETVSVINEKEGDVLVHLAGIVAFWMSGLAGPVPTKWSLFLALDAAIMGAIDRGGMVAFAAAMGLGMAHRPRSAMGWKMIGAIVLAIILLGVSGLHIEIPNGKNRELSFQQIMTNVVSTFGDVGADGLDSTKAWRTEWWKDIINDTAKGPYFWDGKGFGMNLADYYGYQVGDRSLRSPHNAHMTILARMGVPGFVLWIIVQGSLGMSILDRYYKTRRSGNTTWNGLFLFLGAYWLASLINASFDVFLEGPMGGIWFWSLFGAAAGALWIHKYRPDVLDQLDQPQT